MMQVVHIIPRLPPNSHGIGDHAIRLAEKLLEEHSITSLFLSCPEDLRASRQIINDSFPAERLASYHVASLLSALPQNLDGMIVHFGFYVCHLLSALKVVKKVRGVKVIVMVHEAIPELSWQQSMRHQLRRFLPKRDPGFYAGRSGFAQVADVVITNNVTFQTLLTKLTTVPVLKMPNFSNVGELSEPLPLSKRLRRMVVFGSEGTRRRAYERSTQSLAAMVRNLGITEIYDLGPYGSAPLPELGPTPIVRLGDQPCETVSQILAESFAGFIDYSQRPGTLGKSSVFAAYCAHGLLPISAVYDASEADGLIPNQNYIVAHSQPEPSTLEELQPIANHAYQWYQTHTLKDAANLFALHLLEGASK